VPNEKFEPARAAESSRAGITSRIRNSVTSRRCGAGGAISTSMGYDPGSPTKPGNGLAARKTYART